MPLFNFFIPPLNPKPQTLNPNQPGEVGVFAAKQRLSDEVASKVVALGVPSGLGAIGLYWGYIWIVENKMETTI